MFKKLIVASGVKHRKGLYTTSLLFVAIFCLALFNDFGFEIVARYDLLDKKSVFLSMCPQPRYSDIHLPLTALVSFPGSGNTWLRYLVQEASGILTGSEYNDSELFEKAFPAERITNESIILVKTHGSDDRTRALYSRAILLVRHPRDAILAEFNRDFGGGHLTVAPIRSFIKYWKPFLQLHSKAWNKFHKEWLKYEKPMLVVFYTDLEAQPFAELERVLKFLEIAAAPRGLKCAVYTAKRLKRPNSQPPTEFLFDQNTRVKLDSLYNTTITRFQTKFASLPENR